MASTEIPFPSNNPLASRVAQRVRAAVRRIHRDRSQRFSHCAERSHCFVCALAWCRSGCAMVGWSAMGFKRPVSWRRIFVIALVAAGVRILLGQFVIEPVTGFFWPPPSAPALANEITGNAKVALLALLLVWTFAAFGEEIAYRGYLLTRAADIGRRSTIAYWLGIVFVSILFGYGHYYKGPSGIIDSGIAGLNFGSGLHAYRSQPLDLRVDSRIY